MQFYPIDGCMFALDYDKNQTILCAMNTNAKLATIGLARFKEIIRHHKKAGKEITTDRVVALEQSITLNPMSNLILELQ